MANVKVEIRVSTTACKDVYIVGSIPSLGAWNPAKAVKLDYNEETGFFTLSKLLPVGELIEFKVLASKSWDNVEKGWYQEEVENHIFTPSKGLVIVIEVPEFA